ncbi:hypothetical protein [Streptomyces sp. NBC_00582]|uniref:hypothetical protein n=1 Tax=Streptomyces sp. NBC_00582 TaxID=2975783 RepID=UPI002E819411|nr:hypothetical protein [Streptomyces sp. NBC_00582]WUB63864.1 hypothetical protein OG852_27460 [Streptomyces sp. NBC_00582]
MTWSLVLAVLGGAAIAWALRDANRSADRAEAAARRAEAAARRASQPTTEA